METKLRTLIFMISKEDQEEVAFLNLLRLYETRSLSTAPINVVS